MKGLIVLALFGFVILLGVIGSNDTTREARLLGFKAYLNQIVRVTYTSTYYPTCYATYATTACSARRKRQFEFLFEEPPVPFFVGPPLRADHLAPMGRHDLRGYDNLFTYGSQFKDIQSSLSDFQYEDTNQGRNNYIKDESLRFFKPVTFSLQGVTALKTLLKTKLIISTTTGPTVTYYVGCTTPFGTPSPACASKTCSSNSDCPSLTPSCVNGKCIKCTADSDCPSSQPWCITSTGGVCSQCFANGQCVQRGDASRTQCNITSGNCVGCLTNIPSTCGPLTVLTPICDEKTSTCRGCTSNTECVRFRSAATCNTATGQCS